MKTLDVKTRNYIEMLIMCSNVTKHKSKRLLFYEFNFVKEHIYLNEATSLTFDIFY